MEIIWIGLLLAVVYPTSFGLENRYIPPSLPEYTLQSLEEYTGLPDTISPAHTLDQDGYRYRDGRRLRHKRQVLGSTTPATFDDLYADSRRITQNLPDSNFLGPSPDEIAVPSSGIAEEDSYQGPSPDQIARPAEGRFYYNPDQYVESTVDAPRISILQPFQQAFIESAVLAEDGYRYKTVKRKRI